MIDLHGISRLPEICRVSPDRKNLSFANLSPADLDNSGLHMRKIMRYLADGKTPNPDFEMNAPRYRGASILLTKDNFGCGSSREHAPWALHDYGIRCILAKSYADIFFNNCFNNGMLPLVLPSETIETLFLEVRAKEGYQLTIDLPNQKIIKPDGGAIEFNIDPFKKHCLLNGLDQIGLTLMHEDKITAYEKKRGII